jgi:succinate dehydrogenase / fumarate reductase cytochrome b subunit
MSQPTNVGLRDWLGYRGGSGYLLWLLHRVTGLGVLLFLALHIVDIFLLGFGEEVFNKLLFLYRAPWARVLEVFLLFGVTFHAMNGLRIIIQDALPRHWLHQRRLVAIEVVLFLVVFLPAAWILVAGFIGKAG